MSSQSDTQAQKIWFHVFDAATLVHICDVRAETDDGQHPLHPYDPRIDGNGEVIWQLA